MKSRRAMAFLEKTQKAHLLYIKAASREHLYLIAFTYRPSFWSFNRRWSILAEPALFLFLLICRQSSGLDGA